METESTGMLRVAGVKLYDVTEVAKQLGIAAKTVKRMIGDGELKAKKVGKSLYVSETSLKEWVEKGDEEDVKASAASALDAETICVNGTFDDDDEDECWVGVAQQESKTGTCYVAGTVLRLVTDLYVVGVDGNMIPLNPDGSAFHEGQREDVLEALSAREDEGDEEQETDD